MSVVGALGVPVLDLAAGVQQHERAEKLFRSLAEGGAPTISRKRKDAIQTAVQWTVFIPGARGVPARDAGHQRIHGLQISKGQVTATEELALRSKHGLAILECKYRKFSFVNVLYNWRFPLKSWYDLVK